MGRTSYSSKVASTAKIRALFASGTAQSLSYTGTYTSNSYYSGINGAVKSPVDGKWYVPMDGADGAGYYTPTTAHSLVIDPTGNVTPKEQSLSYVHVPYPLYAQYDTFSNKPYSIVSANVASAGYPYAVNLSETAGYVTVNGTTPAPTLRAILYNQTLKHSFIGIGNTIMFANGTSFATHGGTSGGTASSDIAGFGATTQKSFCFSSTTCDNVGGVLESTTGSVWTASTPFPSGVKKGWCGEEIDGKFYVLTDKGIVTSTNHGVTWTLCAEVTDAALVRIFKVSNGLYALGTHLWKSTDNGVSWSKLSTIAINAKMNAIYLPDINMFAFGSSLVNLEGGFAFSRPTSADGAAGTVSNITSVMTSAVLSAGGDKATVYQFGRGTYSSTYTSIMTTVTFTNAPIFKSNAGSIYQISCIGGGGAAAAPPYYPLGQPSCFGGVALAAGGTYNVGYMTGVTAKTADTIYPPSAPGPSINGSMYGAGGPPPRTDNYVGGGSGYIATTSAVLAGSYLVVVGVGGGSGAQSGAVYVEEM